MHPDDMKAAQPAKPVPPKAAEPPRPPLPAPSSDPALTPPRPKPVPKQQTAPARQASPNAANLLNTRVKKTTQTLAVGENGQPKHKKLNASADSLAPKAMPNNNPANTLPQFSIADSSKPLAEPPKSTPAPAKPFKPSFTNLEEITRVTAKPKPPQDDAAPAPKKRAIDTLDPTAIAPPEPKEQQAINKELYEGREKVLALPPEMKELKEISFNKATQILELDDVKAYEYGEAAASGTSRRNLRYIDRPLTGKRVEGARNPARVPKAMTLTVKLVLIVLMIITLAFTGYIVKKGDSFNYLNITPFSGDTSDPEFDFEFDSDFSLN